MLRSCAAGYHRGVHEKANPPRGGGAKPTGLSPQEAAGPPKGEDRFVRNSPDAYADADIDRAIVRPAVGAVGHLRGGCAKPTGLSLGMREAAGPPKGEGRFVRKSPDADIGRAIVRPAVGAVGHLRGGCPGPDARPGGRPRGFPPRAVSASGRSSENNPSTRSGE